MTGEKFASGRINSRSAINDTNVGIRAKRNARPQDPSQVYWSLLKCYMLFGFTAFIMYLIPCDFPACGSSACAARVQDDAEHFGTAGDTPAETNTIENLKSLFQESYAARDGWLNLAGDGKGVKCNVMDLNMDGAKDCLMVDENNLLAAVDSVSGKGKSAIVHHMGPAV